MGSGGRNAAQNEDMAAVFVGFKSHGMLDFVACWFWKAAQYIANRNAQFALVSTNSLCQGEQVAMLWPAIFQKGLTIRFAYPTFSWRNHAKQNAAVHVVVNGVANSADVRERVLFKTENDDTAHRVEVKNISPYLLEGGDTIIESRSKPICDVSVMLKGSQPTDGGHLLLTTDERNHLVSVEPEAEKWIRPILGAQEFLQAKERWCLWLVEASDDEIEAMPVLRARVDAVRAMRMASKKVATQKIAATPHLFGEIRQPSDGHYVLVPSVSSERRPYVPLGLISSEVISTNLNLMIPNATLYEFGILTSEMHNDWMRTVAGRLKSDYRYSATLVYNTFPWPDVSEAKRKHIESLAEEVLLIREDYPDKSLADLYDPDKMPAPLLAAHKALDRAVEALYRDRPFRDASERLEHLFNRYEKLIADEQAKAPVKKARGRK